MTHSNRENKHARNNLISSTSKMQTKGNIRNAEEEAKLV